MTVFRQSVPTILFDSSLAVLRGDDFFADVVVL